MAIVLVKIPNLDSSTQLITFHGSPENEGDERGDRRVYHNLGPILGDGLTQRVQAFDGRLSRHGRNDRRVQDTHRQQHQGQDREEDRTDPRPTAAPLASSKDADVAPTSFSEYVFFPLSSPRMTFCCLASIAGLPSAAQITLSPLGALEKSKGFARS